MKLKFTDDAFVLMALFRYALGRQTYATGIAVENIKANWKHLTHNQRKLIKEEINQHRFDCETNMYGDEVRFYPCWHEITDLKD